MLILTRKNQERVRLSFGGVEIWLQVVAVQRDRIRLGIDAPRGVVAEREEIIGREPVVNGVSQ